MENYLEKLNKNFGLSYTNDEYTSLCKSVLAIYNMIDPLTKSINSIITKKTRYSYCDSDPTYKIVEDVLRLMDKRKSLYTLKVLVHETLKRVESESKEILEARFIDKMQTKKIGELLNIAPSTYFRKQAKAINSFKISFVEELLKTRALSYKLLNDDVIRDILDRVYDSMEFVDTEKLQNLTCSLIFKRIVDCVK